MTVAGLGHLHSAIVNPLGMLAPLDVGISVFKRVGIGLEIRSFGFCGPGVARAAQVRLE